MKRGVVVTAAFVAAVAVWGLSLPPRRVELATEWRDGSVRGVLHIHSRVSDGLGSVDQIAAAAAQAGLQFIVVTDHGDGTRKPDPPSYRSGVLCLDGVEISTRGGHYLAIGLPQAPYPLAGEPRDVVEDVHRLGGLGIAAHPDSPRAELRWADWSAPIDGIELINPDSGWRAHAYAGGARSRLQLARAFFSYPVRPAEAISSLLTGTSALREQWMRLASDRPVIVLAGADAHAKLALGNAEPGDNRLAVPIPSYLSSFQSLSVHIRPDHPLSGDADADASTLLRALKAGQLYLSVDGWAAPPAFEFSATSLSTTVTEGGRLEPGSPVMLRVRSNAPAGYRTTVWRGMAPVAQRDDAAFELPVGPDPGVYSVEIRRDGPDGPAWITSNAIYVRKAAPAIAVEVGSTREGGGQLLFDGKSTAGWAPEADATSLAAVDFAPLVTGARIQLRYGLSGGSMAGQYAAAIISTPAGVDPFDGVSVLVRSAKPMRVSVQLRAEPPGVPQDRWEHSIYVDPDEGERYIRFSEMSSVGVTHTPHPPLSTVRAIMFVVDTTNTAPGASGRLWFGNVQLRPRRP